MWSTIWRCTCIWWDEIISLMFNALQFTCYFLFLYFFYIKCCSWLIFPLISNLSITVLLLKSNLYLRIEKSEIDHVRMKKSQLLVHFQSMSWHSAREQSKKIIHWWNPGMNFEVKFNRRHYYIQTVIISRIEVSNINCDFPVFLWEKNPLNLGMKYRKVMKRMRERMWMVPWSLVHPGYLEMTLSMILFFLFSLSLTNSVAHSYTSTHHSCTYPRIDIGTSFFVVLLSEGALLSGLNNLQKQNERGKSSGKRKPLMTMLWRT